MLTKNRLGRARTILLTIVALTGLLGMTLQPALARTPDVARPAAAVADLDIGALISQLRAFIVQLQAQIHELEKANEAPPAVEEAEEEDEAEDVDDGDVEDVDEQNDDADDEDADDEDADDDEADDEDADDEDADEADEDESEDDHDDEDGDD
jgi:hypothetical protein